MLTILCWKWGSIFSPLYVNRLRNMLARHLRIPHRLVCATDEPTGIDSDVQCVPIAEFTTTPRCRRRMKQYDATFASALGDRILSIDLDVVIVADLTPIVARSEPVVCWKVAYAGVYSGSFVLYDACALDAMYRAFAADPEGYPKHAQANGTPSDQAMLNFHLRKQAVPHWTERDGFVTWFGNGYHKLERHGMGPTNNALPRGARIVVLGSADKAVMDEGRHEFVRSHWR